MLALIEGLGDLSGEHGIHSADDYQHDRVEERYHIGSVDVGVAHQHVVFSRRVVKHGLRWCHYHPYHYY